MKRARLWLGCGIFLLFLGALVGGCAPAAAPGQPTEAEKPAVSTQAAPAAVPTQALPQPTQGNLPTTTAAPTQALPQPTQSSLPTPTAPAGQPVIERVEQRVVELEWPDRLRLGDSDIIRLALVPNEDGYTAQAEFPEHALQTRNIPVERPSGYVLSAVARLEGVGFEIAPQGDQERYLPEREAVAWRWTMRPRQPGQQRLSIVLTLRWTPANQAQGAPREHMVYARGLDVWVTSFLGMTQTQAVFISLLGALLGGGLGLFALVIRPRPAPAVGAVVQLPSAALQLEPHPGLTLSETERSLLQALFGRYRRLVIEREFLSGYSGARAFLAQPVHPDGRTDAQTIVKIGQRPAIEREFQNYERYVKDSLPPMTARIQHPPVTVRGCDWAALQYTFLAEPGKPPVSLRQVLLQTPDVRYLWKLFEAFGPNWWMQRSAYTFRMAQAYDGMLPPHYVLEPAPGLRAASALDGSLPPDAAALQVGDVVQVRHFDRVELRADGKSLALTGTPTAGAPALRVRWLGVGAVQGSVGRVTATRAAVLTELTYGLDRMGLPDPLAVLDDVMNEMVAGSRSILHGDLNLENILVGPGGLVWLIDFAQTGEGHALYDFAHLEANLIARVLSEQFSAPGEFLARRQRGDVPLLNAMEQMAGRCLRDPARMREYDLARYAVCVGALKYANLSPMARQMLYLNAAWAAGRLG